jgi:hypothetical protein
LQCLRRLFDAQDTQIAFCLTAKQRREDSTLRESLLSITATDIAEFIRHDSCARRFKLNLGDMELARSLPFFDRLFNPLLDLALQQSGREKEEEWKAELEHAGFIDLAASGNSATKLSSSECRNGTEWEDFVALVSELNPRQSAYCRNLCVSADIGEFHLRGAIDFLLVRRDKSGAPRLMIVECKASRRDRTYHRIQVALYYMIVGGLLEKNRLAIHGKPVTKADLDCLVVRIDENTNDIQNILKLSPLDRNDVAQLVEDITHLLASDGSLKQIAASDVASLEYQLNEKCGTCIFDVYCLPESGINRSLELLSIEPATARALREGGVSDIDRLSELDLRSAQARNIRSKQGFSRSLEVLKTKALTRKSTLPGGVTTVPSYNVRYLPLSNQGQLPEHSIDRRRLIRIYLSVDYDYVENRVAALAAHVTNSRGQFYTAFVKSSNGWHRDPHVKEAWQIEGNRAAHSLKPLDYKCSKQIVRYKTTPWTGRYDEDTEAERRVIEDFLHELVDAIIAVAQDDYAPIHFYVWSRSEMTRLVEACSRASTALLSHLTELLGCREGLDQLIFSCVGEEVDNRYALGWTSRGLIVATSLSWFGSRFHWFRHVSGEDVDLERVFAQDLFNFKTTLAIRKQTAQATNAGSTMYEWAPRERTTAEKHRFEIRGRSDDSLPAPYWRAAWKTLQKSEDRDDPRIANAIKRYNEASKPSYLRAYLAARTEALRWIEERLRDKNREIFKPILDLGKLKQFSLGVDSVSRAAIDFLRLDSNVKMRDWTAAHLIAPAYRVASGSSVPIKNVQSKWNSDRKKQELIAQVNLQDFDIDPDTFAANCSFSDGDFVRVTPCSGDPTIGQRLGQLRFEGSTCVLRAIDWSSLSVVLDIIPMRSDRYRLASASHQTEGLAFDYATIDESPSDFVAQRVEDALLQNERSPVNQWLDPVRPTIPSQRKVKPRERAEYNRILKSSTFPDGGKLNPYQRIACLSGLDSRIQLLHGPPGTGKTITTAAAVLIRILARLEVGDIVLLTASTHTAVNILLEDMADLLRCSFVNDSFSEERNLPSIMLAKALSSPDSPRPRSDISVIDSKWGTRLSEMLSNSVAVVGGTISSILKLWKAKGARLANLRAALLVVDEASMMVFPSFLALATLLDPQRGQILLAGDYQQLPPIVAHDWINEDRPPVVLYQPYNSAYVAVQNIGTQHPDLTRVCQSPLIYTFRLPSEIRELVNRLYGQERALAGRPGEPYQPSSVPSKNAWASVWRRKTGLYLITHSEKHSKLSNSVEAYIIEQILGSCTGCSPQSIAIITPHRAQRGLLKVRLKQYSEPSGLVYSINTVESFQGGQRDVVIISASESDPAAISTSTKFILDLKRSNVAFSRAKHRLIVICSETLLDFIPPEAADYEATLLWRSLRRLCSREIAREIIEVDGTAFQSKIFSYEP